MWIAVIGAFVAIVVVKQLFGGIGQNFACLLYTSIREPLELPIRHSAPFEHFPLFCLAAVRILMDDTDNLKLEL